MVPEVLWVRVASGTDWMVAVAGKAVGDVELVSPKGSRYHGTFDVLVLRGDGNCLLQQEMFVLLHYPETMMPSQHLEKSFLLH